MFSLSPKALGFLLAIIGTALFSLKSIFIKLAYLQGLDADSVLMLRMLLALPIYAFILGWLYLRARAMPSRIMPPRIKPNLLKIVFLGFIGYFLSSWLDLKGLETISAQLERLTLFSYPILVAVLGALFFKTPLTKQIVAALLITYAGVWVVFNQEVSMSGDGVVTGTLMVFLAALSFSLYVLMGKKVIHEVGSLWFTSIAMIVSSVFVLLYYALFFKYTELQITSLAWLWIILLAVFSTVIPSFMLAEAIAKIGPAQTGVIGTLGPMVTIVLAVVFLNEAFTVFHALGISLVIAGVMVLAKEKKKTQMSVNKRK